MHTCWCFPQKLASRGRSPTASHLLSSSKAMQPAARKQPQQQPPAPQQQDKDGQRTGGYLTSQMGGPINYAVFSFWLFIAFAGFAIALGSLAALQHYENHSGLSDGPTGGWAIKANFPLLNSGRVFRLDWYIVMQQFVTTMMVLLALFSRVIPQMRISLVGFLAATTVLQIISADRLYNLSHFHISKAYFSASRGAAAGYIIAAASDYSPMYLVGIIPPYQMIEPSTTS